MNRRIRTILTFVGIMVIQFILQAGNAIAGPDVDWSKLYGTKNSEEDILSMQETNDGGFILAGRQLLFSGDSATGEKTFLIKTDAIGNTIWTRTFGENYDSYAASVRQTRDGGYVLAGYISTEIGEYNIWLMRTDENGNLIWNRSFGGNGEDKAVSVIQTDDGGYMLTGYMTYKRNDPEKGYEYGDLDIWLIKTDENGLHEWNRSFGGRQNEMPDSLEQTFDGGFIISAWTESYGNSHVNGWLIKIDGKGIEQWNRTLDGDYLTIVRPTGDGGYITAGYSYIDFSILHIIDVFSMSKALLIKTNGEGNVQWKKTFYGYMALSACQTSDNGYIISGKSYPFFFMGEKKDDERAWVIKTDADGNILWSMSPGENNYIASSIHQTKDRGYVISGSTATYAMGYKPDAWLMKLKAENETTKKK
ncbi:MAG TPA: hypothetical protein VN368_01825 [Candidatus Methylomirabilis sp.]|nr:hypothetical protein [Candidatus Methylomirabilis sp.]